MSVTIHPTIILRGEAYSLEAMSALLDKLSEVFSEEINVSFGAPPRDDMGALLAEINEYLAQRGKCLRIDYL
jgi:hypothetical protein